MRGSIRRRVVLAIRQPRQYAWVLAGLATLVLPTFEFMNPVESAIADAPVIGGPDLIYYLAVFFAAWLLLRLVGLAFRLVSRPHPLDPIADTLAEIEPIPSIDDSIRRELQSLQDGASHVDALSLVGVTDETLELFSQLNYETFRRTAFGMRLSEVRRRNRAIHRKLPQAMQLVVVDAGGLHIPVGISYVIPLSVTGQMEYAVRGGVRDSDIGPRHVASSSDNAQAFLLFAMGLAPGFRAYVPPGKALLLPVFLHHIALLLGGAKNEHKDILLYAQTEQRASGIRRFLERVGFDPTGTITGDGCPLLAADVSLLPDPGAVLRPLGFSELRKLGGVELGPASGSDERS